MHAHARRHNLQLCAFFTLLSEALGRPRPVLVKEPVTEPVTIPPQQKPKSKSERKRLRIQQQGTTKIIPIVRSPAPEREVDSVPT